MPEAIGTSNGAVLPYPAGRAWEARLAAGSAHRLTVTKEELDHIRKNHASYDFADHKMRIKPENEWQENEPPPDLEVDEEEVKREALDRFMQENDLTKAKLAGMLKVVERII